MLMQMTHVHEVIIYKTWNGWTLLFNGFGIGKIFKCFWKKVSYALQGYICLIKSYSKNSNIIKYY